MQVPTPASLSFFFLFFLLGLSSARWGQHIFRPKTRGDSSYTWEWDALLKSEPISRGRKANQKTHAFLLCNQEICKRLNELSGKHETQNSFVSKEECSDPRRQCQPVRGSGQEDWTAISSQNLRNILTALTTSFPPTLSRSPSPIPSCSEPHSRLGFLVGPPELF